MCVLWILSLEHITSLLTHLTISKIQIKQNWKSIHLGLQCSALVCFNCKQCIKILLRNSLYARQCFQRRHERKSPQETVILIRSVSFKEKNRLPRLPLFCWGRRWRIMDRKDSSWGECSGPFCLSIKLVHRCLENVAFRLEFNIFKTCELLE